MKGAKLFALVIVATVMLAANVCAKPWEGKIGYLDLSRTFEEYKKTQLYNEELEKENEAFQEERNKLIEKVRDLQSKMALLKEEEKVKMQEDLDKQKQALLEFDRQKRTDLTKRRDEKVREILLEIEKVVSDYAKKEGYTLVLNDRVLIYGGEDMEITEKVLKILNDSYKGKEAKK